MEVVCLSLFEGPKPWDLLFSYFGERYILDDALTTLIFCEGDGRTNSRTMTMTENRAFFFFTVNIHSFRRLFWTTKHLFFVDFGSLHILTHLFLASVVFFFLDLLLVRGGAMRTTPYCSMTSS